MLLIFAPLVAAVVAPAPLPARAEMPIRLMVTQGGARRYSVIVTVNGQPLEAALDTGSVGLRIVAPALPPGGGATSERVRIGFNSGVEMVGVAMQASVGFGASTTAKVKLQRIDSVACRASVPQCDAASGDIAAFRIMSDGVAGQGFLAILGIGLREERLGHPLIQAGIQRWIVELPRSPGETGRLILNPSDSEAGRYRNVPFLPGRNEIAGCIVTAAKRLCAPTMIDSGAPGIQIFGGAEFDLPEQGSSASLALGEGEASPTMPITVGRRDQAAMIRVRPARPDAKISLSLGVAPYLHWSILYDAQARTLGVAER